MRRVLLLGAIVLLAGCGGGGGSGDQGIVAGLESHDVKPASPHPEPPGVLEVKSTVYEVPGGQLHVFTFPDKETTKDAAARIQPDGYMIRNTIGDQPGRRLVGAAALVSEGQGDRRLHRDVVGRDRRAHRGRRGAVRGSLLGQQLLVPLEGGEHLVHVVDSSCTRAPRCAGSSRGRR